MARILIADDETSVRSLLVRIVEKMGHEPVEACNGKEAFDLFRHGAFDLSLIDIQMPEMDGIGFLEHAKEIDPEAVIIVMTGFPSAETIIQTIEDDGYTYIAKPVHVDQVIDLINRGLEFRNQQKNKE